MHQVLQSTLDFINGIPAGFWMLLPVSVIVSAITMPIIKWFNAQKDYSKILISYGVSSTVVAANYLLHVPTHNPSIIFLQSAVLSFGSHVAFKTLVFPTWEAIQAQLAKAAAFDANVKSAVDASAPVADFSS